MHSPVPNWPEPMHPAGRCGAGVPSALRRPSPPPALPIRPRHRRSSPPSTITSLPVSATDPSRSRSSRGLSDRRSTISASIPSASRSDAALTAFNTGVGRCSNSNGLPLSPYRSTPQCHRTGLFRHFACLVVEPPVINIHDGVIVRDTGQKQPFGVPRCARHHHLQARHMHEPAMQGLGMLGCPFGLKVMENPTASDDAK